MKLSEAIKEIQNECDEHPACLHLPYYLALHLGIEAMKRIEEQHHTNFQIEDKLLPGETEE